MLIRKFLHNAILVTDLPKSRQFYEEVLGLSPSPRRPEMRFAGVWYEIGEFELHLIVMPNPDRARIAPEHGGNDRHFAFAVADLDAVRRSLEAAEVPYTLSQSGRGALFCRDPEGNAIEFSA